MLRQMDFSKVGEIAEEAAKRLESPVQELVMHAWPQMFGSTAGPHGGIGGQAVTTFQVLAFEVESSGKAVKWCHGCWKPWDGMQRW